MAVLTPTNRKRYNLSMSNYSISQLKSWVLLGYGRGAWYGASDRMFSGAIPVTEVEDFFQMYAFGEVPMLAMVPCSIEDPGFVALDAAGNPYKHLPVEEFTAWVRKETGQTLGIHGAGSYSHAGYIHNLVEPLRDLPDAPIETAGVLGDGAQAWVMLRSDEMPTKAGMDFRAHVLFTDSVDGTLATTYTTCATYVVCDNTRACALNEGAPRESVRHTSGGQERISEAIGSLGLILADVGASTAAAIEKTAQTIVAPKSWDAMLDVWAGLVDPRTGTAKTGRAKTLAENKRDQLGTLYSTDPRCEPWKGTQLGVEQTFNTWAQHVQETRKQTREQRRFSRLLSGEVRAFDQAITDSLTLLLNDADPARVGAIAASPGGRRTLRTMVRTGAAA